MAKNRRKFISDSLKSVAAASAASLFSNAVSAEDNIIPGADSWNTDHADKRKNDRILKIGGVFGLFSHTDSTWWRYFNPPEGYARATGMRITHIWCVDGDAGRRIAERFDCELVRNYTDMIGLVDGVFIDDFFAAPFMPDLSLPYLEAGIPCCFDRPMATSIPGLMKVINASRSTGTPFMVPSAYEYLKEVEVALLWKKDIGELISYNALNSGDQLYKYIFHGLCFSLKIVGTDVSRIGHRTASDQRATGLTILEHDAGGKTVYGTIHHSYYNGINCGISLFGKNDRKEINCVTTERPWYLDIYSFLPMQHAMERMIKTGKPPETLEYTEAKIRIFLSLLYSHYEKNGGMVEVTALPDSWDAGFPKGFDRSYPQEIIDRYRKILKKI